MSTNLPRACFLPTYEPHASIFCMPSFSGEPHYSSITMLDWSSRKPAYFVFDYSSQLERDRVNAKVKQFFSAHKTVKELRSSKVMFTSPTATPCEDSSTSKSRWHPLLASINNDVPLPVTNLFVPDGETSDPNNTMVIAHAPICAPASWVECHVNTGQLVCGLTGDHVISLAVR